MNKSFLILLVLVIFLGAGFGGSFVGGVMYGQSLEDDAESQLSPRLGAGQLSDGFSAESGRPRRGQGRRDQDASTGAFQEPTMDTSTGAPLAERQLRQGREAQGGADGGADSVEQRATGAVETPAQASAQTPSRPESGTSVEAARPAGEPGQTPPPGGSIRGGVVGTIQGLEGDTLTVAAPQGGVAVILSDTTAIYLAGETDRESLTAGANVRVTGARDAEGVVNAQAVFIMPEGAENLFGSGRQSGRQERPRP